VGKQVASALFSYVVFLSNTLSSEWFYWRIAPLARKQSRSLALQLTAFLTHNR
jgi:hypothetical protein